MSPLMRKALLKGDKFCIHNPFKSDIYSLGILLLELVTISKYKNEGEFKKLV